MRRATIVVLLTACLGLAVVPAAVAGTTGACGLVGYETAARGAAACPVSAPSAGEDAQSDGFIGGLLGGALSQMLSQVVSWVARGAGDALRMTASLVGSTTTPPLTSAWFSATYSRVGTLSALLTLPFLFAACVHALIRGDLAMVGRAAFGYLPLAALGVVVAAPLTALLLAATDQMCSFVSAAAGNADAHFLDGAATAIVGLATTGVAPFLVLSAASIVVGATFALWLELLIRAAAVEVIVLMLPLFFAAMVWPARRMWAIRAIETLVALILSKFAIVAVLALGSSAVTGGGGDVAGLLTGAALVVLAVMSPWALLRLLPLHEVAAAAAAGLSQAPGHAARSGLGRAAAIATGGIQDGAAAEATVTQGVDHGAHLERLLDFTRGRSGISSMDDSNLDQPTRDGIAHVMSAGDGSRAMPAADPAPDLPAERPPTDFAAQRPFVIGADGDDDVMEPLDHGPAAEWFDFPRRVAGADPAPRGDDPAPVPSEPPPPVPSYPDDGGLEPPPIR